MNLAEALHVAANRRYLIEPKKPNPKAGTSPTYYLLGGDKVDLEALPRNTIIWALTSISRILQDHSATPMVVFKKGNKAGIVGAQVINTGAKIRRAAIQPINIDMQEYLAAYQWVSNYLGELGVNFTSFSWASEQIFRMQFHQPLKVSNPVGKKLLRPSRGICQPGHTYHGPLEKWDIKSAYPFAMMANAHRFPTRFIPIKATQWDRHKTSVTLARVIMRETIPDLKIPVVQEHYTQGIERDTINWFWNWELETILESHNYVEPLISYRVTTVDLSDEIGGWLEALSPRLWGSMGFAGKLLKGVANSLWGSYAAGDIHSYTWVLDEHGNPTADTLVRQLYNGKIGSEHIASWVNSLVSDRVYREFIGPERVHYFDTDGGFCEPTTDSLGNGKDFGAWELEGTYRKLKVVDWQAYAAYGDSGIEVVLSGVPDANIKDLHHFGANHKRKGYMSQLMEDEQANITHVSLTTNQVAIMPPFVKLDPEQWAPLKPELSPHVLHVGPRGQDFYNVNKKAIVGFQRLAKEI